MALNKTIFLILEDNALLRTTRTKPIVDAIKNRKKISFYYAGPYKPKKDSVKRGNRIDAEAVALGLSKKGNLIMRAWVEPPSVSKKGFEPKTVKDKNTGVEKTVPSNHWRTFMLSRMKNVQISDETFNSKRPQYKEGEDNSMSVTYVTSDWTKKQKAKPEVKPKAEPISVKPTPTPTEPTPTEPIQKTPEELPQPKPQEKPVQKQEPIKEPTKPEDIKPEELPQPKPEEKPSANPEDDIEDKELQESIKKIKHLMFL